VKEFVVSGFKFAEFQGGVTSALSTTSFSEGGRVEFLSADVQELELLGTKINPISPEILDSAEIYGRWFGEDWHLMFPVAHTNICCPPELLKEMFAAANSDLPAGSYEQLVDLFERDSLPQSPRHNFAKRYGEPFSRLVIPLGAEAIVKYQDFFLESTINMHAPVLRQNGAIQELHIHASVPDNLERSRWGRDFLEAISQVDTTYVHSDVFAQRLEKQIANQNLSIPSIKKFTLGVDVRWIERCLAQMPLLIGKDLKEKYPALTAAQNNLINEHLATSHIDAKFVCVDRLCPTKGVYQLLCAVEQLLESSQLSLDSLRQKYRFFFAHQLLDKQDLDPNLPGDQYLRVAREKHKSLQEKFPGVIFVAEAFTGKNRDLLPILMRGCHGISNACEEGLGLAIMEIAVANRDLDRTIISGSGSGFAMEAMAAGHSQNVLFVDPRDISGISNALHFVGMFSKAFPGHLGARKERLVSNFILKRTPIF